MTQRLNDDENELLKKNGLPVKVRYSVKELSHSLGINSKTLYGWCYVGRYDAVKIGGSIFYSVNTVLTILQQDSTTL